MRCGSAGGRWGTQKRLGLARASQSSVGEGVRRAAAGLLNREVRSYEAEHVTVFPRAKATTA
jgi:hypothetical protein